jgi:hypothetical protein
MVASISANHGSLFFTHLKRGDNHPTKNSNPSCTAIIYTLPPPSHGLPIRSNLTRAHFLFVALPTSPSNPTYPAGIYTLYIMSLTSFIHLPMKVEPIRSSETSSIKTQTPGNYPKRNILQLKHCESLKTRFLFNVYVYIIPQYLETMCISV